MLRVLMKAMKPVHGAVGLRQAAAQDPVSVVLSGQGQAAVGAVTPAVPYADAAKVVTTEPS